MPMSAPTNDMTDYRRRLDQYFKATGGAVIPEGEARYYFARMGLDDAVKDIELVMRAIRRGQARKKNIPLKTSFRAATQGRQIGSALPI
jgi:hypothetical protein